MGEAARPRKQRNRHTGAALRSQNNMGVRFMVERERETIVTTDGGERRGGGTLLAVVLLIALLVVLFLLFGRNLLGGTTEKVDADIKIDTPAK
jgi:hypothetical protein